MESKSEFIKEVEEFVESMNLKTSSDQAFVVLAAHKVEGKTQATSAIIGGGEFNKFIN